MGKAISKRFFCVGTYTPKRCGAKSRMVYTVIENWIWANSSILDGKGGESRLDMNQRLAIEQDAVAA